MTYTQHEIDSAVTLIHNAFSSREEYFEWVAKWKAHYKELSVKIREQKKVFKVPGIPDWREYQKIKDLKSEARSSLLMRRAGKIASWQKKMARMQAA